MNSFLTAMLMRIPHGVPGSYNHCALLADTYNCYVPEQRMTNCEAKMELNLRKGNEGRQFQVVEKVLVRTHPNKPKWIWVPSQQKYQIARI